MMKEKKSITPIPDPILAINEFEEESISILDLSRKETSEIIEKARLEASDVIQKQGEDVKRLEKEYLKKVEEELSLEKKKLNLEIEDKLQKIQDMPNERIEIASHHILDRVIPKGA